VESMLVMLMWHSPAAACMLILAAFVGSVFCWFLAPPQLAKN
jgi:hypothetical protein